MKKQTVGSIASSVLPVKPGVEPLKEHQGLFQIIFCLCKKKKKKTSILNIWPAIYKCAKEAKEVKREKGRVERTKNGPEKFNITLN